MYLFILALDTVLLRDEHRVGRGKEGAVSL